MQFGAGRCRLEQPDIRSILSLASGQRSWATPDPARASLGFLNVSVFSALATTERDRAILRIALIQPAEQIAFKACAD
jgi:hypothetical protein